MSTADAAIKWVADNYLGTAEPYAPRGGEWIPFQEEFGYPPNFEVEWCGGLWMKAIKATGGTIGRTGTVPNCWHTVAGVVDFMNRGDWYPADGTNTPQRGDLVFFTWQGSGFITHPSQANDSTVQHVEGVVDPSRHKVDGSIITYGGNVAERCGSFRRYDDSTMVGFGRPRWNSVAPAAPPKPAPIIPTGAIGARWSAIGGVGSVVGKPLAAEADFLPGVRAQRFERGTILSAAHTGAWELYGGIAQYWVAGGGTEVGLPLGPEVDTPHVPGGRWQRFARGYIAWHPDHGTHVLKGAILMAYLAADPATRARYGPLVSNEQDAKVSLFKGGRIAWQRDLGAWAS
jgi:hypothetical protein